MTELLPDPDSKAVDKRAPIRAVSGSRSLVLSADGIFLTVRTRSGELLDPKAAEVIIALGGKEPSWLRLVEALQVVNSFYPGSESALVGAAEAIGRNITERARLAKESSDRNVILALAAIGQMQVVNNPNLDADEWGLLVNHRDEAVRAKTWRLATVLPASLADYPDDKTRVRVARNRDCPTSVLTRLADDGDLNVMIAVGANPATPVSTLKALAKKHHQPLLRRSVASNPSAPGWTLARLVRDRMPMVRAAAVTNPSLPRFHVRGRISDLNGAVRSAAAMRSDLGPHTLSWLERFARHDSAQQYALTRTRLAHNPSCPQFLKDRLERINIELRTAVKLDASILRQRRIVTVVATPFCVVGLLIAVGLVAAGVGNLADAFSLGIRQLVGGVGLGLFLISLLVWLPRRSRAPGARWRPPHPIVAALSVAMIALVCAAVVLRNPADAVFPLIIILSQLALRLEKRANKQRRG